MSSLVQGREKSGLHWFNSNYDLRFGYTGPLLHLSIYEMYLSLDLFFRDKHKFCSVEGTQFNHN